MIDLDGSILSIEQQAIEIEGKRYPVSDMVLMAGRLEKFKLPIKGMNLSYLSPCDDSLVSFVQHIHRVNCANLSFPIILAPNGVIADGRHRLAKALLQKKEYIYAIQLERLPMPISEEDEA